MRTIGIGELQKNMGILSNLKEVITVVDKRKNRKIAVIYPIEDNSEDVVEKLAGSLSSYTDVKVDNLEEAKEKAFEMAMREKYGFSD